MMRFQIYSRFTLRGRRWFWRLRAENGEVIAQGQSYSRKIDAREAVALIQRSGSAAVEVSS